MNDRMSNKGCIQRIGCTQILLAAYDGGEAFAAANSIEEAGNNSGFESNFRNSSTDAAIAVRGDASDLVGIDNCETKLDPLQGPSASGRTGGDVETGAENPKARWRS